jgi:hypothetical protein
MIRGLKEGFIARVSCQEIRFKGKPHDTGIERRTSFAVGDKIQVSKENPMIRGLKV